MDELMECMAGWMDEWVLCTDGFNGWTDKWILLMDDSYDFMDWLMDECLDFMGEWMVGWMDIWIIGWTSKLSTN